MSSLTSGAAVFHKLTGSAFLQSIATLAAGGTLCIGWRDHGLRYKEEIYTTTKNRDSNDIFPRRNSTIHNRGNQN